MAFLLRSMWRYNGTDKEATQGFGPRLIHRDFSPVQKWRRAQARRFFCAQLSDNLVEVMEAKDSRMGVRCAEMQSASLTAKAWLRAGSQMHFPLHEFNGLLVQVAYSSTVVSQGS